MMFSRVKLPVLISQPVKIHQGQRNERKSDHPDQIRCGKPVFLLIDSHRLLVFGFRFVHDLNIKGIHMDAHLVPTGNRSVECTSHSKPPALTSIS